MLNWIPAIIFLLGVGGVCWVVYQARKQAVNYKYRKIAVGSREYDRNVERQQRGW